MSLGEEELLNGAILVNATEPVILELNEARDLKALAFDAIAHVLNELRLADLALELLGPVGVCGGQECALLVTGLTRLDAPNRTREDELVADRVA